MNYAIERLREPSTYAGIGLGLSALGLALPPGALRTVALLGMAAAGVAAVVMREGWRKALLSGDAASAVVTAVDTPTSKA